MQGMLQVYDVCTAAVANVPEVLQAASAQALHVCSIRHAFKNVCSLHLIPVPGYIEVTQGLTPGTT
jgi:hypothetical protein